MKKISILGFTLFFILIISSCVYADTAYISSDPGLICTVKNDEINKFDSLLMDEPIYENLLPTSTLASTTINITSPCDKSFRKKYPSTYAQVANRAIESADDYLGSKLGIDYLSVAQPLWEDNGAKSDSMQVLYDAIGQHGLVYNGSKQADLMIAFSGKVIIDSDNNRALGQANDFGGSYCVVFDYDAATNAYNVQHETGHLYGLRHDDPDAPVTCVMKQGNSSTNYNHLCTTHYNQWKNNKGLH